MNLNELSKQVHENAVAHGWWDEERSFAEIVSLIHSELSEALEEYRSGRGLDEIYYECKGFEGSCQPNVGCAECEYGKPEGIPIELADVIIRICDYFGQQQIGFDGIRHYCNNDTEDLGQLIADCHYYLSQAYKKQKRRRNYLKSVIVEIMSFYNRQRRLEVINKAIDLKMAYNITRPYKHGGKRI